MTEYSNYSVQLQNIESELEQKGNLQILKQAPALSLNKPVAAQIVTLDAPSPLNVMQESESVKEPLQVAGK
jgi:hypothetical protein